MRGVRAEGHYVLCFIATTTENLMMITTTSQCANREMSGILIYDIVYCKFIIDCTLYICTSLPLPLPTTILLSPTGACNVRSLHFME